MKKPFVGFLALSLLASSALAAPRHLVTHNLTNLESNAYIAGEIPSTMPTAPLSTNVVTWFTVKMVCFGHTTPDGLCPATIKMATNTANPITIGNVYLNLNTGQISPSKISANGYSLTVNGLGEATLTKE